MQLQNNLHNLSEQSKKNNSELDNNSQKPIIFQNSSNGGNRNINKEEKENITTKTEFEKNKKYNLNITNNHDNFQDKIHKNIFHLNDKISPLQKKDKSIDNNMNNTCSNIQNIGNNSNIFNTNDDNFFNYSFYNNNIINNNKFNENDEEQKNIKDNIQNNKELQKKPYFEQTNLNFQNIEPNNNITNCKNSFFSIENSNNNFKKKSKHKKHFKVRFGDWICPKCENLNFSFRTKCNRCGLSKGKIENYNDNQNNENNLNLQRPIIYNNININYIFNSNFPLNNINLIYNPLLFNTNNINNYYGNYNNYQIYYPSNVNIK